MSIFGNNLTRAKAAAQWNADHFHVPYYVVSCIDGLRVERERPVRDDLISFTAMPCQDIHDFRDRGDPMVKFEPSRPDLDLDTAGRPLKPGS